MDNNLYAPKGQGTVPPLQPVTTQGQLMYAASHNPIKVDIHGSIDKGFFLADNDWTCYRRNYFSCICSFSLTPYFSGALIQYTPNGSATPYDVFGFSMTISAIVADTDAHNIELVQHTPKRDKGPVMRPDRVSLSPKQSHHAPNSFGGMYSDAGRLGMGGPAGGMYEGYNHQQGALPNEHTFERIQFKQATANNGKRRAAQQYYHLLVELHAHVGEAGRGSGDQWMRIAYRKSAKMIVRGRSPGHYQTERRGSASSGPGGSAAGGITGYPGSQVMDYPPGGSSMMGGAGGYATGYDPRSGYPGSSRHHDISIETGLENSKDYPYYTSSMYDSTEARDNLAMYPHRHDQDSALTPLSGTVETSPAPRVKNEGEGTLPSLFYPGSTIYNRACSRVEGKPSSVGYYPAMLSQST